MTAYWWRLSRRGWLAGAATGVCAVVVLTRVLNLAGDVAGTVLVGHLINMVVASAVAAPLGDAAAAVLDATAYPRLPRRLAPSGCALLQLATIWLTVAAAQATRVGGVPWGGLAVEAAAMTAVACAAAASGAGRADPGLVGTGVLALIVTIDQSMPAGPWLTADAGPRWEAGRVAWLLLGAAGAVIVLLRLRDPGGRRVRPRPWPGCRRSARRCRSTGRSCGSPRRTPPRSW